MFSELVLLLSLCVCISEILGHGRMVEPPNRSSVWRVNSTYRMMGIINYNDNENFCGGYTTQWSRSGGKCGVCGDPYRSRHPQANENTGRYGKGLVVRQYRSGSVINVQIWLSTNHRGTFEYSLCRLYNPNAPEAGEKCFQPLRLANGAAHYIVRPSDRKVVNQVKLPNRFFCKRCVLRWHYTAGNNWGICKNGMGRTGCGPQETFRSCADISIL